MRKMFNVCDSSEAQDCGIFRKREKFLFHDVQIFSVIGSYEHLMARQLIKKKVACGAFSALQPVGRLYTYPKSSPHSSPEAPRTT